MIDRYDWAGGREAMLRFGPATGPVMVATLPLMEEANRTRTFVVGLLRALALRGIASVLPDVPGQGESLVPTGTLTVLRMAEALEAVTGRLNGEGRRTYALGIRSGTLLDYCALHEGRWHLSPIDGSDVLRDLHRTWLASGDRPAGSRDLDTMMYGDDDPVEIAGNLLSSDFLSSLSAATPFDQPGIPRRVVRLSSDPRTADRHVEAAPLWRRAEPGDDPALAALLADDIAAWLRLCDG
ncbi:hypothetical protein [Sphingomonas sp. Leaf17]|uniref:hypothetical protein n=1 Tax=Sphingomonas sp. Leaf17 TaxID=1735683 RepID=UPI000A689779|nr:hypothetical protein [Sphingomonas sp. Leaf17]